MATTTMQISKEMKEKIAGFGNKGETYEQILKRIYDAAVRTQLRELLMSEENTITLEEFSDRIEKKWPKSS